MRNSTGRQGMGGCGSEGYGAQQIVCSPVRATFCAAPGAAAWQLVIVGVAPTYLYALKVASLEMPTHTSVEIAYAPVVHVVFV